MEKKNLKDIVYNSIQESIYSSEYLPNEIITESQLIQKFGFSKSPVREALTGLCHEGVLKNIPRCGYQVVTLTSEDIKNILEYRLVLESGMIKAGVQNMDEAYFDNLEELALLCGRQTDGIMERWLHNVDFHSALISAARNPYARICLSASMMTLYRAYAQIHWHTPSDKLFFNDMKNHAKITEALRRKDTEAAVEYLRKDLGDFGSKE